MAYLYLNFIECLKEGKGSKAWGKEEFYTQSLEEQYESIRKKLQLSSYATLQQFVAMVFPDVSKTYYISMPSFERSIKTKKRKDGSDGNQYINNIVVIPQRDYYLSQVLPERYELVVIGDLTFGNVTEITVKGIELIDANVMRYGEKSVNCNAACAFAMKSFMAGGRLVIVPDYGVEVRSPVLTNDFVDMLATEVYPVPEPYRALHTFSQWKKYINFRNYYLKQQSEKCEEITAVTPCNAFMITKDSYRRKEEELSPLLLDGVKEFARGEQIILSKEVTGAESFPLIRVDIQKNRKKILSERLGKYGTGKPKYESYLNRYTREPMGLSSTEPKYDERGLLKGQKGYLLGERYLFAVVDIEPDLSDLDKQFAKEYETACKEIDGCYAGIIANELKKYMQAKSEEKEREYKSKLSSYQVELRAKLDEDVAENKDKEVIKEYEEQIKNTLAPYKRAFEKKKEDIERKLKKVKEKEEITALKEELLAVEKEYEQLAESIRAGFALRDFYVARNERRIAKEEKRLSIVLQAELDGMKEEKESQLKVQYQSAIHEDKKEKKQALDDRLKVLKVERIENETIRQYQIYFRPNDTNDKVKDIEKALEEIKAKYLTYDNRAEKAKIDRQEKALNSLMSGYVKNPFLPTYLFAPKMLKQTNVDVGAEPEWCLASLNEKQKLAVKRALASESIFLLQGPPGTGKTQVIAEITAQLTKQGKKVLISSETHKAIDNVFERLPKIPEIRPLRLIPSTNAKETNYSPEKLVDNFYLNICGNLEKQVKRFEHFEETKADFDEQMRRLRFDYEKVLSLKKANEAVENERSVILGKINRLNGELEQIRLELSQAKEDGDILKRTQKYIENYRFAGEGVVFGYIERYREETLNLLQGFACFDGLSVDKIEELAKLDIGEVKAELAGLLSEDVLVKLKGRQQELRNILQGFMDADYNPPQEGDENYDEFKKYQKELIGIGVEIKNATAGSTFDFSSSKIFAVLPSIIDKKELLKVLVEELTLFQRQLQTIIFRLKSAIQNEMEEAQQTENAIAERMNDKQIEISRNKGRYEELGEEKGIEEYNELNSALKRKITQFFADFGIVQEYNPDNSEEAFTIIATEWRNLEENYKATQAENAVKIPTYKEIIKYLSQEDILEEDRQAYTRALFDCVNVFGITCTSRDRFTDRQMEALRNYGIKEIDIRTQGIDVVIVDEVSKSSFLDLLIPILYGKTIILVGDHRQLPPMYDLRHMRGTDFEGLDEEIINEEINKKYTALYEECFFKTLYESVPENFKVMLNKQYRCHSHIMEVFNHFYGGGKKGLTVGKKQQDDEKEHGLTVRINGNTVIEPRHHIYFVDCNEKEASAFEGSTSKINEQEAQVAMTLLKELDKASSELIKQGKIKVSKEKKIDERPSIGVICTYGDQAGNIKKKRKNYQFNGFSGKQDEKLVISTVDDFQGDERDIIIVSMVRNPSGNRYDAEFIKKFERINVALSRARKMLIIVGSKDFLEKAGVIDLPDLDGDKTLDRPNFPVYREIIDTIYFRGRVLSARDIIGE